MPSISPTRVMLAVAALALLVASTRGPEGRWEGTFSTPHGDQPLAFEISAEGPEWRGSGIAGATDIDSGSELVDLAVTGDSLSFDLAVTTSMGAAVMHFAGAVAGDQASGIYDMTGESLPMPMRGRWAVKRD